MFSPRETELLAESQITEWRERIVPAMERRRRTERLLAGHAPRPQRQTWLRMVGRLLMPRPAAGRESGPSGSVATGSGA